MYVQTLAFVIRYIFIDFLYVLRRCAIRILIRIVFCYIVQLLFFYSMEVVFFCISLAIVFVLAHGGSVLKLLGVPFDTELSMGQAVSDLVSSAGWKLRTLLLTTRFYSDADLIVLYTGHLLSYLEYRTPAIYHSIRAGLCRLDAAQRNFLREVGVYDVSALLTCVWLLCARIWTVPC